MHHDYIVTGSGCDNDNSNYNYSTGGGGNCAKKKGSSEESWRSAVSLTSTPIVLVKLLVYSSKGQ